MKKLILLLFIPLALFAQEEEITLKRNQEILKVLY